jgi:hypothetical protein
MIFNKFEDKKVFKLVECSNIFINILLIYFSNKLVSNIVINDKNLCNTSADSPSSLF